MLSNLPLTFISIVERGSITRAADDLDLAKSAVSQNLKRLEEKIGVKLATRTTRSFTLTPAGERYYNRCKEMLTLQKIATTEMENFGAIPAGPITVTAPHALIASVVAPAMVKVLADFPLLQPNVVADDRRLDIVESGIDVSLRVGLLPDSALRARRIGKLVDLLCVSPDLLSKNESADNLSWIQSLPYIAHTRESRVIKHKFKSLRSKKTCSLSFRPTFFSNTVESQIAFAKDGIGVALLPEVAVYKDLKAGRLVALLHEYKMDEKPIYAVHAYDTQPPKSVLTLIKAFQRELKVYR